MMAAPVLVFSPASVQCLQVIFWVPILGAAFLFVVLLREHFNHFNH